MFFPENIQVPALPAAKYLLHPAGILFSCHAAAGHFIGIQRISLIHSSEIGLGYGSITVHVRKKVEYSHIPGNKKQHGTVSSVTVPAPETGTLKSVLELMSKGF